MVKAPATPTWCSVPASSKSPSSSEPMTPPLLCQRKPATTQSAVRWCFTFTIVRLSRRYGCSDFLTTTPSRPAPSKLSNQAPATFGSSVEGVR